MNRIISIPITLCILPIMAFAAVPSTPEPMSGKTALQFFADNEIKAGWNLGNTMDAVNAPSAASETAWSNPKATQQLFDGVADLGFDIVRIPVTWLGHIGPAPDYALSEERLQRVAEIIEYGKNAGIKAMIINIHHDGNNTQGNQKTWGFVDFPAAVNNATKKTEIQNQIATVWTQIANYFKNYGDYLIFETLNEVHNGNWGNGYGTEYEKEQDILFDWNQAALSAIRATGGNNATRFVAVPGLGSTEPDIVAAAHGRGKLLPNDGDNGKDKLIVSVHYYSPAQYTVAGVTDQAFGLIHTWGTQEERDYLAHDMESLKAHFIDDGVAVYIGEYGAPTNVRSTMSETIKNTHINYIASVASEATKNRVVPIYWDDGGNFKIIERSTGYPKPGLHLDVMTAMMDTITSTVPPIYTSGQWKWNAFIDNSKYGENREYQCTQYNDEGGYCSEFTDENGNLYDMGLGTDGPAIELTETNGVARVKGGPGWVRVFEPFGVFIAGLAVLEASPNDAETTMAFKSLSAISFKLLSDSHLSELYLELPTSDIEEGCHYYYKKDEFVINSKNIELNISDFTQPQGCEPKPLNTSLLQSIRWRPFFDFDITISDLALGSPGNPEDPVEPRTNPAKHNSDITAAKAIVEAATYTALQQASAGNANAARTAVQNIIDKLELNGVVATVVGGTFTAATAGTATNENGTNGSFTFTVNLNKGYGTQQTTEALTIEIIATQYDPTPIISSQIASSNISAYAQSNAIVLQNLPQNAKVQVYNLQGKRIYSVRAENLQPQLQIGIQAKGLYFVKVNSQTLRVVVK